MIARLPKGFTCPMEIGGGAYATVYRVRQVSLDRWVALKMVREKDRNRRRAIVKEAQTQARLHIKSIPQVYDTFEWGGSVCIVMQWINGISLKSLMAQQLSSTHRLWLTEGLLSALAALHAQGYAHRDIKPENILLSPEDGVFLVDFGFTKNVNDGEMSMAGYVKGTPAYMAPELWSGSPDIDYLRADVYAAGKICSELLQDSDCAFDCSSMTAYNPDYRPASGVETYRNWQRHFEGHPVVAQWEEIAAVAASGQLAERLFNAAHELLYAGREEEAYWLLVECLQQRPNHARAVGLMESFPEHSRKKRHRKKLVFAAGLFSSLLVVAAAFLAGKISSERSSVQSGTMFSSGYTLRLGGIMVPERKQNSAQLDFRFSETKPGALDGELYLSYVPRRGSLYVDDILYGKDSSFTQGFSIGFGLHTLIWRSSAGQTVWKEHVQVLPFESQGVHIDAFDQREN